MIQEDNMYLNDGEYFQNVLKPKDQANEQENQKNEVLTALPLLNEMVKRFEERIAFYQSIDAIPDEVVSIPEELAHVIQGNKLAARCLKNEKNILEGMIAEYTL